MGGYGSGRHSGRATTASCRSLEVGKLQRAGVLRPGSISVWEWKRDGDRVAWISLEGSRDSLRLNYRSRSGGGDWEDVDYRIPLEWRSCRFGGERPYFRCPGVVAGRHCGRRVARLFGAGRWFLCRHCYQLGYASQRDDAMSRCHARLAKLHGKLGADYDGPDLPPPRKPKGMRWRTYNGLAERVEAEQDRLDVVFIAGAERLLRRSAARRR